MRLLCRVSCRDVTVAVPIRDAETATVAHLVQESTKRALQVLGASTSSASTSTSSAVASATAANVGNKEHVASISIQKQYTLDAAGGLTVVESTSCSPTSSSSSTNCGPTPSSCSSGPSRHEGIDAGANQVEDETQTFSSSKKGNSNLVELGVVNADGENQQKRTADLQDADEPGSPSRWYLEYEGARLLPDDILADLFESSPVDLRLCRSGPSPLSRTTASSSSAKGGLLKDEHCAACDSDTRAPRPALDLHLLVEASPSHDFDAANRPMSTTSASSRGLNGNASVFVPRSQEDLPQTTAGDHPILQITRSISTPACSDVDAAAAAKDISVSSSCSSEEVPEAGGAAKTPVAEGEEPFLEEHEEEALNDAIQEEQAEAEQKQHQLLAEVTGGDSTQEQHQQTSSLPGQLHHPATSHLLVAPAGPSPARSSGSPRILMDTLRDYQLGGYSCSTSSSSTSAAGSPPTGVFSSTTPSSRPDQFVEVWGEQKAVWSLYGLREKLANLKPGMRLFSPKFTLFGIKEMRLVFYPAGAQSASPGYCSLGLHLPERRNLRFKLSVGKVTRFAQSDAALDSYGFSDMCEVEKEIEQTTGNGRSKGSAFEGVIVNASSKGSAGIWSPSSGSAGAGDKAGDVQLVEKTVTTTDSTEQAETAPAPAETPAVVVSSSATSTSGAFCPAQRSAVVEMDDPTQTIDASQTVTSTTPSETPTKVLQATTSSIFMSNSNDAAGAGVSRETNITLSTSTANDRVVVIDQKQDGFVRVMSAVDLETDEEQERIVTRDVSFAARAAARALAAKVKGDCEDAFSEKIVISVEIIDDAEGHEELRFLSGHKVQWTLYNFPHKLTHFPKGASLYSPRFSLQGMDNLALKLYPNGKQEADPGWCSVYLEPGHDVAVGDEGDAEKEKRKAGGVVGKGSSKRGSSSTTTPATSSSSGKPTIEKTASSASSKAATRNDTTSKATPSSSSSSSAYQYQYQHAGASNTSTTSELRCRFQLGNRKMTFERMEKFDQESIWGFLAACKVQDEMKRSSTLPLPQNSRAGSEADTPCWIETAFQEEARRLALVIQMEIVESKKLHPTLHESEDIFLKNLPDTENRRHLLQELTRIDELSSQGKAQNMPSRLRILSLKIADSAKTVALQKWENLMGGDQVSAEGQKMKKWMDGLFSLPFGVLCEPPMRLHDEVAEEEVEEKANAKIREEVNEEENKMTEDASSATSAAAVKMKDVDAENQDEIKTDETVAVVEKLEKINDPVVAEEGGANKVLDDQKKKTSWSPSAPVASSIVASTLEQGPSTPFSSTPSIPTKNRVQAYLARTQNILDEAVFGHQDAKEKILQLICQWIANPESQSLNLGIQGPPGNGKTTLCRHGIAQALNRPFTQISLGGATDAALLEGHNFTYVGSTWGRLAGMLMETRCMNPIIFFDELDKLSDTPRGEEITGVLTHLTDHSQNSHFTDRYFDGIPLDFSKALFIFSFNDETKLNPVLKDRLTIIKTKGFSAKDQLKIAQEYLLPKLLRNVGMQLGDVLIEDLDQLRYICLRWGLTLEENAGVRGLRQALEAIVLKVNKLRLVQPTVVLVGSKSADAQFSSSTDTQSSSTTCTSSSSATSSSAGETSVEGEEQSQSFSTTSISTSADEQNKENSTVSNSVAPSSGLKNNSTVSNSVEAPSGDVLKKKGADERILELPVRLTRRNVEWLLPANRQTSESYLYLYT
ncbi:unnamed protein product [Amoebophrya sp. A25]|nr:unnamed protein product [Amoebophrya sp. A25]|eukprot:GSA25T00007051001.1